MESLGNELTQLRALVPDEHKQINSSNQFKNKIKN